MFNRLGFFDMHQQPKTNATTTYEPFELSIKQTHFQLLPEKAIFLPQHRSLLIADPHFGKAAHFRKAGIPVPENVHTGDYLKINSIIKRYLPSDVFFLGDLFHSDFNNSWNDLEAFRSLFSDIKFHLIKGNHDILPEGFYRSGLWELHEQSCLLGELLLSHEPEEKLPLERVNICGHIHPGISLYGAGRQKLTMPCYFVSPQRIILPAFGRFTGLAKMSCGKNDRAFAVAGKKVIEVNFSS